MEMLLPGSVYVCTSKVSFHYAILVLCVMLEKIQFIEPYFLHTTRNGTWYIAKTLS